MVDGYSDSLSLLKDIRDQINTVFYLCPGTVLNGEVELILDQASYDFTIRCADTRRGCIWDSSTRHLVVHADDTYTNVTYTEQPLTIGFEGITFRKAEDVSVVLEGFQNSTLSVFFSDCNWEVGASRFCVANFMLTFA